MLARVVRIALCVGDRTFRRRTGEGMTQSYRLDPPAHCPPWRKNLRVP